MVRVHLEWCSKRIGWYTRCWMFECTRILIWTSTENQRKEKHWCVRRAKNVALEYIVATSISTLKRPEQTLCAANATSRCIHGALRHGILQINCKRKTNSFFAIYLLCANLLLKNCLRHCCPRHTICSSNVAMFSFFLIFHLFLHNFCWLSCTQNLVYCPILKLYFSI